MPAAADELTAYPRPTAVSGDKVALVESASEPALRAHGRLPDRLADLAQRTRGGLTVTPAGK